MMTIGRIFTRVMLGSLFVLPFGQVLARPVVGQVVSANSSPLHEFSCKDGTKVSNNLPVADVMNRDVVWLADKELYQVTTDHGPICLKRTAIETNIPAARPERGHCISMGTSDTASASSNGLSGACNN